MRTLLKLSFIALLCALFLTSARTARASESPAATHDEEAMPAKHEPVTMKVGIVVTELNKLDLATGSFNAEMIVMVHCDHEPCKPELEVANGKIVGKPEKLHDEKLFKILKMKAELAAVIDLSEYPYDTHELQIVLEDKGDPEQIKFVM